MMRRAQFQRFAVRLLGLVLAGALPLGGCSFGASGPGSTVMRGSSPELRGDVGTLTYRAVDRLVAAVPELAIGKSLVVGSIVDVQRVDRSMPFGNLVADLARSRFVQRGVQVSEMRLRGAVLMDRMQGEITLANDRNLVRPPPSANAILTGTYAAGDDYIFVSLKVVSVLDARIVAAVDFEVPRRGNELFLMPAT